jgi:hypothetical protein
MKVKEARLTDWVKTHTQTQQIMAEFLTMQEAEDKFGKRVELMPL